MGPEVVVPEAESPKLRGSKSRVRFLFPQLPQAPLERPEEPLHPSVLPGGEGLGPLVADAEHQKYETKEPGGEGGLVVGPQAGWPPKAFDEIEQSAKHRDRRLSLQGLEGETGAGALVDDTEKWKGRATTLSGVGEIQSPDAVAPASSRLPSPQLAPGLHHFLLAKLQHLGDIALADRHRSLALGGMEPVEGQTDRPAASPRHESLEANDLFVDPGRLGLGPRSRMLRPRSGGLGPRSRSQRPRSGQPGPTF